MLHVAFLWHLHQPTYQDPETLEVTMPWVRLHGVKDYTDLALALAAVPEAPCTVNIVPGLSLQLQQAALDLQHEAHARFILKPAEALTDEDKVRLGHEGFACSPLLRERFPFFASLAQRFHRGETLSVEDWRAVQIGYQLVWTGHGVFDSHPELNALLERAPAFEEADKLTVLKAHQAALSEVLPRWKTLYEQGHVELSASPFYHPILPLLLDTHLGQDADPHSPLPKTRLQAPEDARWHLTQASQHHHSTFGQPPSGLWPSEGSLTHALVPDIVQAGFRWALSDQGLLRKSLLTSATSARSLDPHAHLFPYECQGLTLLFRDLALSDKIGFSYAKWPKELAYRDFCSHLSQLIPPQGQERIVLIALDGENCWEHYPEGVLGFLPGLLKAVAALAQVKVSTISQALARLSPRPLPRLASGSWIGGTFRTWMGDPMKNRAWDLLTEARRVLVASQNQDPKVWDLLYRAEASDWWWWFGEGHSSTFDGHFDALFRAHLRALYHALGQPIPLELTQALSLEVPRLETKPTLQCQDQPLTGKALSYYRTLELPRVTMDAGSMQAGSDTFLEWRMSNSQNALYLHLHFLRPLDRTTVKPYLEINGQLFGPESPGVEVVQHEALEFKIARTALATSQPTLLLSLQLRDPTHHHIREQFPAQGYLAYTWVSEADDARTRGP